MAGKTPTPAQLRSDLLRVLPPRLHPVVDSPPIQAALEDLAAAIKAKAAKAAKAAKPRRRGKSSGTPPPCPPGYGYMPPDDGLPLRPRTKLNPSQLSRLKRQLFGAAHAPSVLPYNVTASPLDSSVPEVLIAEPVYGARAPALGPALRPGGEAPAGAEAVQFTGGFLGGWRVFDVGMWQSAGGYGPYPQQGTAKLAQDKLEAVASFAGTAARRLNGVALRDGYLYAVNGVMALHTPVREWATGQEAGKMPTKFCVDGDSILKHAKDEGGWFALQRDQALRTRQALRRVDDGSAPDLPRLISEAELGVGRPEWGWTITREDVSWLAHALKRLKEYERDLPRDRRSTLDTRYQVRLESRHGDVVALPYLVAMGADSGTPSDLRDGLLVKRAHEDGSEHWSRLGKQVNFNLAFAVKVLKGVMSLSPDGTVLWECRIRQPLAAALITAPHERDGRRTSALLMPLRRD